MGPGCTAYMGPIYRLLAGMRDRFFPMRAYIGIIQSCMYWYVRKKNPSLTKPRDANR